MYDVVKRLYLNGKIDTSGLDKAIGFGWITEVQKAEIINSKVIG